MTKVDKVNIISLIFSVLGVLISVLAGFVTPLVASIAAVGLGLISWMVWVTITIVTAEAKIESRVEPVLLSASSLPYNPFYFFLGEKIMRADSVHKKIKIPATFLTWPRFTLLFWVEVTEEFFRTHTNRYVFSYTTNTVDSSGHPNGFYLRLNGKSTVWQFVIKGNDSTKQTRFTWSSAENLLGWKLFCVRWSKADGKLDFSIDAGHVFRDTKSIGEGFWPQNDSSCQFHLGGWQDNWPGGISELRFYNFRLFENYLSNAEIEVAAQKEKELLKKA